MLVALRPLQKKNSLCSENLCEVTWNQYSCKREGGGQGEKVTQTPKRLKAILRTRWKLPR